MLSSILAYAATRAAGETMENIARRALWSGIAGLFVLAGIVFGLLVLFWSLESEYGTIYAAAAISIGAFGCALAAYSVPLIADWLEKRRRQIERQNQNPIGQTAEAVEEETEAAVDYFGAMQVVTSAFLFGLGIARSLKK